MALIVGQGIVGFRRLTLTALMPWMQDVNVRRKPVKQSQHCNWESDGNSKCPRQDMQLCDVQSKQIKYGALVSRNKTSVINISGQF